MWLIWPVLSNDLSGTTRAFRLLTVYPSWQVEKQIQGEKNSRNLILAFIREKLLILKNNNMECPNPRGKSVCVSFILCKVLPTGHIHPLVSSAKITVTITASLSHTDVLPHFHTSLTFSQGERSQQQHDGNKGETRWGHSKPVRVCPLCRRSVWWCQSSCFSLVLSASWQPGALFNGWRTEPGKPRRDVLPEIFPHQSLPFPSR